MYCTFYGLKERPFTLTPNPEFIFLGAAHQEAFAHLLYGIGQKVGFIALTGEVGAGKTTVIRTLLTRLEPEQYATALILNPMLSSLGLLKTINREFGITDAGNEPAELVEILNQFLITQKELGKTVVLVIDEAQDMEAAVLEQVRLLSNLETATEKLIQIILVGQPELETLLARTELRQLNQRITVRYHMAPMNATDTRNYLAHRLRAAGSTPDLARFSNGAAALIHRFANGLPRLVNAVADRTLLIGYNQDTREINTAIVRQAIKEVAPSEARRYRRRNAVFAYAAIALILLGITAGASLTYLRLAAHKPHVTQVAQAATLPTLLQRLQERSSAQEAYQTIGRAWELSPRSASQTVTALEPALKAAGFETLRFSGNLGGLARLGYPAILELTPATNQKRYLVFGGLTSESALVADQTGNLVEVPTAALEQLWNGRAIVPWKNALGLRLPVPYTTPNADQGLLARLLASAGVLQVGGGAASADTLRTALQSFQSSQGLEPDGIAGAQTVLLLYRQAHEFRAPILKKAEHTTP